MSMEALRQEKQALAKMLSTTNLKKEEWRIDFKLLEHNVQKEAADIHSELRKENEETERQIRKEGRDQELELAKMKLQADERKKLKSEERMRLVVRREKVESLEREKE